MPPPVKLTKEEIVQGAFELVRREGIGALNARELAKRLSISTQPIYSHFGSMEALRLAVIARAGEACNTALKRPVEGELPYKAIGLQYVRFAREEPELFRLLFMQKLSDREKQAAAVIYPIETLTRQTGLSSDRAQEMHLSMWIVAHGIAAMVATGFAMPDEETISRILTRAYRGVLYEIKKEKE